MSRQLVRAAKNGNLPLVRQLVENGVDVHAMCDKSLRKAAVYGHLETVKYLVVRGANIFAKNNAALKGVSITACMLLLVDQLDVQPAADTFENYISCSARTKTLNYFKILKYLLSIHIKTRHINSDTFSASMLINNFKYTRMHLKHNITFANHSYIVDLDIIVSKLMIRNTLLPSYIQPSSILAVVIDNRYKIFEKTNKTRKLNRKYKMKLCV